MQRWEYLVLRGEYGGFSGRFMPRYSNEQELRDWKKISLYSFLNQLGADGWELISTSGYPPGNNENEMYFKRPKP